MSRIVFDEPAWWQRPHWRVVTALALMVVALIVWWAALTPRDPAPPPTGASYAAAHTRPQSAKPAAPPAPAALAASSLPAASHAPTRPPLSTMVAPGVHITPLSVPPGTVPTPAGPSERDSEPEN